ncbi:restriction endonuclease [candidate division WOR-3 bacterium]|uniref:Restriction endonuclease n=1 Tax=candidate division WOR-3 bacterium TaxID=2052148 RepID=A0A937XDN2_UNCW3|nr:restriction endonuclease [candidate division WOR-3 bacterium]
MEAQLNPEPTGASWRGSGRAAKAVLNFLERNIWRAWLLLLGSMAAHFLHIGGKALAFTSGAAALMLTANSVFDCIVRIGEKGVSLSSIAGSALRELHPANVGWFVLVWLEVAFLAGARGRLMAYAAIAAASVLVITYVVESVVAYIKDAGKRAEPCQHGVRGALHRPRRCAECVRLAGGEKELKAKLAAEADARRRAAEAEANAEAMRRRQESYAAYLASIRLPQYLRQMDPREFELLVCSVYGRLGYDAKSTPYAGDGGVDGYLKYGGNLYLLQCKRVKGSVGRPVLQQLSGCVNHHSATGGIVVTTGTVSKQARRWAKHNRIDIVELGAFVRMVRKVYPDGEVVPDSWQASPPPQSQPSNEYGRAFYPRRSRYGRR